MLTSLLAHVYLVSLVYTTEQTQGRVTFTQQDTIILDTSNNITFNILLLSQKFLLILDKRFIICVHGLDGLEVNLLRCLVTRSHFIILSILYTHTISSGEEPRKKRSQMHITSGDNELYPS